MEFNGNVFLTGGVGTLGQAFMQKAKDEEWDCQITVYSRDWKKQNALAKQFPDVRFVKGDILSYEQLKNAMVGHDTVIHMAAMKDVVAGEEFSLYTIETNVDGSRYVCQAAVESGVKHVIGISSDKATSPANCYGATKMLMERIFQEYAREYPETGFHLTRYGNVWASAGSFIHNWKYDLENLGFVRSTDKTMTRFWITTDEALELIYYSMHEPSGCTLIPYPRAAKIGDIEEWLIPEDVEIVYIGQRPGEKKHECLLSMEEGYRTQMIKADNGKEFMRLHPATVREKMGFTQKCSSNELIQMRKDEFLDKFGLTGEELADDHS